MDVQRRLDSSAVLLLDGAMGTQLEERGQSGGGVVSLRSPETVKAVHAAYVAAGSQAIITNTLTMNRVYLETHGVSVDAVEANAVSVALAKEIAGDSVAVLGNLGSTGQMLEPYGTFTQDQFEAAYREQAKALEGADGFLIETMFDLGETLCAVRACRAVSDIPVFVSMTFTTTANGGRTMMGNSAEDCARSLTEAGATVIGSNCGDLSPVEMAEIVSFLRNGTDRPILIEPNAGKPKLEDDRAVYDMAPGEFAAGVGACIKAGAQIIGGCCGTTPAHIAELARQFVNV